MKYNDFQTITRSRSIDDTITGKGQFAAISSGLLEEALPLPLPIRLMGLTLSNLEDVKDAEPPRDEAVKLLMSFGIASASKKRASITSRLSGRGSSSMIASKT